MKILSIDPGSVSAAWGFHEIAGSGASLLDLVATECGDVPVAGKEIDIHGFLRVLDNFKPDTAIIEKAGVFPKQGAVGAFNYGAGYGILRTCLAARRIPFEVVTASVWKRKMGLDDQGETSRAAALRLYPALAADLKRKKDHNKAEALLLGRWAILHLRHDPAVIGNDAATGMLDNAA